ncbi:G2/M phase-specific E3 ubiquitin-protein ligase [Acropora cervicornis]|uniref:G2/M phase-specific E3 ubiquitin-protein ligase n=1 Tax=Acropora cervicornis TaxID=6130 RepID=A0AAD9V047_ACRCE|nr:G2/M phase-specific E3 ubiquitin-protein ligase [Acropora cervicornis]
MTDYWQILRECAERLISTADRLTVDGSNQSQANRGSNAGTSQDCEPSALKEHRRIFGYRPPVGSVQSARSSNSRGKRGGSSPYFIPRNTWTRSFVCLAKKDSRSAPSASKRIALSAAELGEKKIVFHKCGNSTHVHEKITEAFPALASAGGYEILRIADDKSKNLMEIPMSGSDYSVSYLKGTLGQAKAYIRPIQKDLSLEESNSIKEESPLVNCVNCNVGDPLTCHEMKQKGIQEYFSEDRDKLDKESAVNDADDDDSNKQLLQSPFNFTDEHMPVLTLDDVMHSHKRNLGLTGRESLAILREDLWRESVAIFKNPQFQETARPMVTFEGEAGIDGGGLGKEFGTLLREKMFSPEANIFEGIHGRKLPIYSMERIYSRMFQLVGKMMSYLIIHLDIHFPCFSPPIYEYIVSGSFEAASHHCCLDDICDYEIKELIGQVTAAKSEEELVSLKQNGVLVDSLVNAGWLNNLTLTNRNLAMQTFMVHLVLQKRKEPLDQLCKGLKTLGVLDLVRA